MAMEETKENHEKHPVAEALRSEIQRLAHEGDKEKGGTLTPEVLARIVRVAKNGRDLLVSMTASDKNLASMVKKRRAGGFGGPIFTGSAVNGDDDLDEEGGSYTSVGALSPSPPMENFGTTAIRELIAAAKSFRNNGSDPVKVVEALALAREKGMDDVAKELETQLGVKKELPAPTPAAAPQPVGATEGGSPA